MNEHFHVLKTLLKSTEKLLSGKSSDLESLEIRASARDLNKSLQPCLQELKVCATRFQPSIKSCLDDLTHAEDVWNSKSRVLSISTTELWMQIGNLTSFKTQYQKICQEQMMNKLDNADRVVVEMIELIKMKYFWDAKNNKFKVDLGWSDKDNFNKNIKNDISIYISRIESLIKSGLSAITREASKYHDDFMYSHINSLDRKQSSSILGLYQSRRTQFKDYFENVYYVDLSGQTFVRVDCLSPIPQRMIEKWRTQGGYIELTDIDSFKEGLKKDLDYRINTLFSQRQDFIENLINKDLSFYNDLLEKQNRYRQETPEQRLAEKAWIDGQKRSLLEIQAKLDEIINA